MKQSAHRWSESNVSDGNFDGQLSNKSDAVTSHTWVDFFAFLLVPPLFFTAQEIRDNSAARYVQS